MTNLTGTCQYSTMCGWCTKWDKKCDRKIGCEKSNDKTTSQLAAEVLQDMLITQKGINFNDMPTEFKRGVCCIKEKYYPDPMPGYRDCKNDVESVRTRWVIDKEIPIFTQDRNYIERTFKEK